LINNNANEAGNIDDSSNNKLKNPEILQHKLNNALPILFVL